MYCGLALANWTRCGAKYVFSSMISLCSCCCCKRLTHCNKSWPCRPTGET